MRYFVSAWLWNLQTSGTSAMIPIQSNQVRGGTRISAPFLSFLPLSLCLSSAIEYQLLAAHTNMAGYHPQPPITTTDYRPNHRHFNRRTVVLSSLKQSPRRNPSTQNTSPAPVVATTS